MLRCKICSSEEDHKSYVFEEQMIGLYHKFDYFRCSVCGCLQIKKFPENLPQYYGEGYYSFRKNPSRHFNKPFINLAARILFGAALKGRDILLNPLAPDKLFGFWTKFQAIGRTHVTKRSKILDVGSGSGSVVYAMGCIGFRNVKGIDPFIDDAIHYENGVSVLKEDLTSHDSNDYDLIMMHHSFEHMANPHEVFENIPKKLASNGVCLIRIPTISSSLFEKYGANWVGIDAPRHLFIHSKESIEHLAKMNNLKIDSIVYDSTPFQFWGSELYNRRIALQNAYPLKGHFTKKEMNEFRTMSKELNEKQQGGRFCVYLSKLER